ncbi:MAG: ATP-binding domain-containing protein, partial [Vicinamibacteraceae bacterium]|nr:ATP-binding domain-containing protein [Vicinamibacteraceae bacterium]
AASAVIRQNTNRKEKRLWTEKEGGSPIVYFRAGDELEEADFISRVVRGTLADDVDGKVGVLYRINSQSRAIEDALMRDGVAYRIVGGVRFYERKEIKDTLAYLKLVLNPHDDVSFRRVVNVPPRGIGKGVMEALESADPSTIPENAPPLVAAGLHNVVSAKSMWAKAVHLVEERRIAPRAQQSLRAFHDLVLKLQEAAKTESVATTIERVLDWSGYWKDLRDERSEEAEGRLENLAELVSAAREYEQRDPEASLGGFVDRLSLLSEADEEGGQQNARVWLMTMHAAKGLEFPTVVIAGLEDGLFPHSRSNEDLAELEEERRLCYVGMTRAQERLILTGAARRRVFGEYQATSPSRFLDEVPSELMERHEPYFAPARVWSDVSLYRNGGGRGGGRRGQGGAGYGGGRGQGWGAGRRGGAGRVSETGQPSFPEQDGPAYLPEDEDQSQSGELRLGMRVRHAQFGVGTVIALEPGYDDTKVTVRFPAGVKKLLARFARLQPA